ncbi:hypothetical protein [Gordonia sp. 'Campus']|uniref:hypothetical protein n=1 Tax=Gordonia sp. 'Campus' TaxID=2915824 RepID=UPI001EE3BAC0|nr:hypothetical protein [Gordonia sp. 'Campus']
MTLRIVDCPSPGEMRPRWAAYAAILAARGSRWSDGCWATPDVWHYDDGGGNWADLVFADASRAVLVGHDHEYSETYYREGAAYFGEPETDLLAGSPPWWGTTIAGHLGRQRTDGMWIGFVYGFDDGGWRRADYAVDDGFVSLNLPFRDTSATVEAAADLIRHWCEEIRETPPTDLDDAVRTMIDSPVTEATLHRALGPVVSHADVSGALIAAHRFARF